MRVYVYDKELLIVLSDKEQDKKAGTYINTMSHSIVWLA